MSKPTLGAPMAKSMFMAWASPVDDESESEFNAWYDGTHVPQVRAAPTHRYIAVYEMDTDDVAGAMAALGAASTDGRIELTATMDLTANPPVLQWYHTVTG